MTEKCYRCENEYGGDPCTIAEANRQLSEHEITPSMDEENPSCPGKTLSGKPCGRKLVSVRCKSFGSRSSIPFIEKLTAVGVVCMGLITWWFAPPIWFRLPLRFVGLIVVSAVSWFIITGSGEINISGKLNIEISPKSVVLSKDGNKVPTGSIAIRNSGDDVLEIIIEVEPRNNFTLSQTRLKIPPGTKKYLSVELASPSKAMQEGQLLLYSNASDTPNRVVPLVANPNPWWVYDKLDESSSVLK